MGQYQSVLDQDRQHLSPTYQNKIHHNSKCHVLHVQKSRESLSTEANCMGKPERDGVPWAG